MKTEFGTRNFLLIWFGQMISGLGSRLTSFALGIWTLQSTGSTTRFALVFVAMAVPALLISPIAGALVDRWNRRLIMIVCEAVSALTLLLMAWLLSEGQLALWHVYAGVGITAVTNAFLQPAYAASIPLLVDQKQLTRMNGLVQTGYAIAQIGGPLLAGILVSTIEIQGVLLVDAISFLVGVLALLFAAIPNPARASEEEEGLWREAATGFRYVRERPGLFGLLLVFGASNFLFGIASIIITPLILSMADATQLGFQMAIGGAGLLIGGIAMSMWGGPSRRIHGVLGFSFLAGICLAFHGLQPSFPLIVIAGFAFFMTLPVINSCNASLWQSKVPANLQGRCFAIQRLLSEAAMPLGFCIAGPMAEHIFEPLLMPDGALANSMGAFIGTGPGRGMGFMFIVLGLLMTVIAALAYQNRSIRYIEEELPDIVEESTELPDSPSSPALV